MKKLIIVLSILLVGQVALSIALLWPKSSAMPASAPLWSDFKADEVKSLTVSDKNGNTVTIARKDDGWVLPKIDDYPAQADKVTPVLEKLGKLKTNRLVARTEGSHRRLQVAADDFNRLLDVEMKDGSHRKLYVGSSAAAGATHFRDADHGEVYLTADLNSWEVNPQVGSWIDTLYFTATQTATVSLKLENANGVFDFKREGDKWTLIGLAEDEVFNDSAFNSLLNQATSLRMKEPLGKEAKPDYGMDTPLATLTLTTELEGASTTYTVTIGAKDAEGNYVARASTSPYHVRLSGYVGDAFANKKREDFISPPATSAASVESELLSAAEQLEATATPVSAETPPPTPEPLPSPEATAEATAEATTIPPTAEVSQTATPAAKP